MHNRTELIVPPEELERQKQYCLAVREMQESPRSYYVVTYGCQMNAHDSEKLAGMLDCMGLQAASSREEADFVIFNTCCIRDNAERRALGNISWLREIQKKRPQLRIAVCGCMVQEPDMASRILKQYPFVDLAFGTSNLHRFPELMYEMLSSGQRIVAVDQHDWIAEGVPVRRTRHDAAYITIMYGCNNYCSYCIVPAVRGRERSRDPEMILREAESLHLAGVKEIMLLGQNVNSYGKDLAHSFSFAELLRQIDQIGIPRIRFMTSHPKDLSDQLIRVMAESRHILPQFHLPVQSGNDEVLLRMNRHYNRNVYLERVRRLREAVPGIGLSTDVIVGFPGETEEQFQDTLSLAQDVRFDSMFTFIYSPRVGTKAAGMPDQISPDLAGERLQRLITLQESLQQETLGRFLGHEEEVLVESLSRRSDEAVSGKGRHGISVTVSGNEVDIGSILTCRITGVKNNTLTGERTEK